MRADAQIDRKQVLCPNVSHLGYDKYKAQFGDIVLFIQNDRAQVGRVIGRVHYAPALEGDTRPIRDYLVVAALSDDLTHVGERWVSPDEVTRIYDPTEPDRKILEMITFFFGASFKDESVERLRRWTGSGFSTPTENEVYMERIRS